MSADLEVASKISVHYFETLRKQKEVKNDNHS